jgi:hypothetical protein
MGIDHISDHGLEDYLTIMTIGFASQINHRDELQRAKEELNNSLVLILQLV